MNKQGLQWTNGEKRLGPRRLETIEAASFHAAHTGMEGHQRKRATCEMMRKKCFLRFYGWRCLILLQQLLAFTALYHIRKSGCLGNSVSLLTLKGLTRHFILISATWVSHQAVRHTNWMPKTILVRTLGCFHVKNCPETVADYLILWMVAFVVCRMFVRDNGNNLKNDFFRTIREKLGIDNFFSLPHCLWSNGKVEIVCREFLLATGDLLGSFTSISPQVSSLAFHIAVCQELQAG